MRVRKQSVFIFFYFFFFSFLFAQEALKSLEEEYYDFLSLTGVVERPTLGYRTLSDNIWKFNTVESFEENEDGTFTKVRIPGEESEAHVWKKNNLGTTYTLWEAPAPAENWFTRGIKQGFTARIYGPEWFNSYNTAAPYGQNDGALWQGRGYNTALTAGVRLEGYGVEVTFKPQVCWMENREFEYKTNPKLNKYNYFVNGVDLVQRYGNDSLWYLDLGDTELRYSWKNFTIGFGNQYAWLGPSHLNPMLGSNNASTYTKFDIGIRNTNISIPFNKQKMINIGNIEGRLWIGQLEESSFYDTIDTNNKRLLTALSISYAPSFINGLTIGINRVFITYWMQENFKYIFRLFTTEHNNALAESGNDEDQKIALFANWKFPKIGFEVYGEFGLDDFTSNQWTNPFHTAIYTIGAKQFISMPWNLKGELLFEWNNFEMSQDYQLEFPYLGYYSHGFVKQGYTSKGQIIGAGTAPFGNSQYIAYKLYFPSGTFNLFFHRYCPNNNYVYSQAVYSTADKKNSDLNKNWYDRFETYFVYGGNITFYINNLFIDFGFSYLNLYCLQYKKTGGNSLNFTLQLKYQF